jgi:quercetin dioxygenase-like cupin family protein
MPETTQTPTGQYPKSQPAHHLDLEKEADRLLTGLPNHERKTQNLAREGGVSLVLMAIEAGDVIREHSTPGSTVVQVVRGHVTLTADGKAISLRPGEAVLFQPALRHDLRAEEQSVVLLTVTGGEK